MAITGTNAPSKSSNNGKGYFVNHFTVELVEQQSNQYKDTSIMVKAVDNETEFVKSFFINGNYERDEQNSAVIGWKFPELINDFFHRIGSKLNVGDNGIISDESIDDAKGKEFYGIVYYSTGKYKYNCWNQIASIDEGDEYLADVFEVELGKGYPRDFKKYGINDSSDTEFNYGANVTSTSSIDNL